MNPRLRAALIGGGIVGVVSGLLYPAGEGQVFVTVNGFFGGVFAAYLYLHLRPATAKSLYGNGAFVGLVAAPVGGIPMTLVLMITGGQTEWSFALFLFLTMLVGAILGPIGGMIGMAIFQTHLALDNSKISRIVAVLGSAFVLVGTFLPFMTLPLVGRKSMASFILEDSIRTSSLISDWWGLLAPSMAVLSVVLVKRNQVKWCWIPGLVCVFAVLYPPPLFPIFWPAPLPLVDIVTGSGGLAMAGGAILLLIASARAALRAR